MKTAIFGFSGSGKTDMFAALAGEKAAAAGNRAMVKVPEPRLDPLIKLFTPKKVTLIASRPFSAARKRPWPRACPWPGCFSALTRPLA